LNTPNVVGGFFSPAYTQQVSRISNTPNGSWGMVQIQPNVDVTYTTKTKVLQARGNPSAIGKIENPRRSRSCQRLDLKNPPTAVGGIQEMPSTDGVGWTERSPNFRWGYFKTHLIFNFFTASTRSVL